MKRSFKSMTAGKALLISSAALCFAGTLLYFLLDGNDRTFSPWGAVCAALCGALCMAALLRPALGELALPAAALGAAAFGFVLRAAVPSLSDVWNGVNFIGGNAALGMTFTGVYLLAAVLAAAACFGDLVR